MSIFYNNKIKVLAWKSENTVRSPLYNECISTISRIDKIVSVVLQLIREYKTCGRAQRGLPSDLCHLIYIF